MVIVSGVVTIYYNIIITWVLYYLGMSFTKHLPWADCTNEWNTKYCMLRSTMGEGNTTVYNSTLNSTVTGLGLASMTNLSDFSNASLSLVRTPAEEFWE